MKLSDLIRDPKAWLIFTIGSCGALSAVPELPWWARAITAALGSGALAVKAYLIPSPARDPQPEK